MKIVDVMYGNLYSKILDRTVYNYLFDNLCARDINWFWIQKRTPNWDGYTRFFNKQTGEFLTGLLSEVKALLEKRECSIRVLENKLIYKDYSNSKLNNIELRDYQIAAVKEALKYGRGIIQGGTGCGKTEIMASLIKEYNCKTLVLTHKVDLYDNAKERFINRLDVPIGDFKSDKIAIKEITVGMIPTLNSRLKYLEVQNFLNTIELLIIDECHMSQADSFQKVVKKIKNAKYRFGFSATPFTKEPLKNLKIKSILGNICFNVTSNYLIKSYVLALPEVRFLNYLYKLTLFKKIPVKNNPAGFIVSKKTYRDIYLEGIVRNPERNLLIQSICNKEKKGILIIVSLIEHGNRLNMILKNSVFIHGSTENNSKVIKDFDDGLISILIASSIMDEGIDITNVEVLILAVGLLSENKLLQRIGRGLRKKEDNRVIIYDFKDLGIEYLGRHAKIRRKIYDKQGFKVIDNYILN